MFQSFSSLNTAISDTHTHMHVQRDAGREACHYPSSHIYLLTVPRQNLTFKITDLHFHLLHFLDKSVGSMISAIFCSFSTYKSDF